MRNERSEYSITCSTAAKRNAARDRIAQALANAGATVKIGSEIDGPREISISASWGKRIVSMSLDGDSPCGAFLAHWHGGEVYPVEFGEDIHGSRNQYHGCKATGCYNSLEVLIYCTVRGFEALQVHFPKPRYYDCGICGAMHSADWNGDCRENEARLTVDEIEAAHGLDGWQEVAMDDLPGYAEQFTAVGAP